MSDPFRFTTIAHAGRALLGPLSLVSVDALLDALAPAGGGAARPRVLDVGCGKGEILLRAMRRFGATGTGVEPNPTFAADARAAAHARGLGADLVLHEAPFADAPLAGATFEVAVCTGAAHAFGGAAEVLAGLARLVPAGGAALFGCGYWRQAPAPEYLAAFGGSADELLPLDLTVALPAAHGWTVVTTHASTTDEWDDYEGGYARNVREWLAAHPADADAPAFRQRIETWNAAYGRWGRDTMGFVTLALRRG